ncbi:MAG: hypothetical protein JWO58_2781 [Chitinophagaceae bacterium]|nr:hypothetical protein [Chitinophagaceae bacterium]
MKVKFIYSIVSAVLLVGIVSFSSCTKTKKDYKPSDVIVDKSERDSLLLAIITIIDEHIPDTVQKKDRFKPENQFFFKTIMPKYDFDCLYKNDQGEYLYFLTKPAMGVPDLYVGLAGKFKLDANHHIYDFEESFRMFRMYSDELNKKGMEVYNDFVAGKDLSKYHKDLNVDPYIEFPNEHVGYDKKKMDWYIIKPY